MKRILTTLFAFFPLAVCGAAYGGTLTASLTNPVNGGYSSQNPPPIEITFTDTAGGGMNTSTVTSGSVTVTDQNNVTYPLNSPTWNSGTNKTLATFTFQATSIPNLLTYTVKLASTVKASNGDTINCTGSNTCSWSFIEESTAPVITGYSLSGGYSATTPYTTTNTPTLTISFSQTIDTTTVTSTGSSATFYVNPGQTSSTSNLIAGTTSWNSPTNKVLTWTPTSSLTNNAYYTVTMTTGVKDTAKPTENALTSGLSFTFMVDTTAPYVTAVSPIASATGVGTNTTIQVTFSAGGSGMNANLFTPGNITILNNTTQATIPFTETFNSTTNVLTLTPAAALDYNINYTVSLVNTSTGIADNAGNPLSCNTGSFTSGTCSWSFTTKAEAASTYTAYPSFMCTSVLPNVLIILDNSASFDEDLYNNAIGSPMCATQGCSRSIIARQALINLIQEYGNNMNIGLMTYNQNPVSYWYLHNNFYFASFDPRSYCPNPPAACQTYCNTEDPKSGLPNINYTPSANEQACLSSCVAQNALFQSNFRDSNVSNNNTPASIITTIGSGTAASPLGSPLDSGYVYPGTYSSVERFDYCSTTYPKTSYYKDTTNNVTIYYNTPGTYYNPTIANPNPGFIYSPNTVVGSPGSTYDTYQYPSNLPNYYTCAGHTPGAAGASNSTNLFQGCSGPLQFAPTPDDEALGFLNYGQFQYYYYTSPTWYAGSSPGGGYLNVPIAANNSSNAQETALLKPLAGIVNAPTVNSLGFQSDPTGYMSCSNTSAPNTCPQIINAGYMAFNGTLLNATQYFNGTFTQNGTQYASPIQYPCQKNFIIYITDGSPSVDENGNINTASNLMPNVLNTLAGLRCPANPVAGNCKVSINNVNYDVLTYVLGMGIVPIDKNNINSMAVAGGTSINNGQAYLAIDVPSFNNAIANIFINIISNVASGTAASILNNSQGSGSNLLQAMFYPSKLFTNNSTPAIWIGEMQNLWYYLDQNLQNPTIREDTNHDNILEMNIDNILGYIYSSTQGQTLVNVYTDANGTNTASTTPLTTGETPDQVNSLWSAGKLLWQRNLTTDPRTVYTGYNSTLGQTPQLFSSSASANFVNSSTVWSLLQIPVPTVSPETQQSKATTLVNYILGTDQPTDLDGTQYRSRQVTWWGTPSSGCGLTDSEGCTREWKLGDIVSSTPKLVSPTSLATYSRSAPLGYNDSTYYSFTTSSTYTNRGMAFVGANDGMLHAFKLGLLQEDTGRYNKAQINDPATGQVATSATKLGREEWAFIPQNALPYLDYYSNVGYDHIFYVDRTPTIVDASIGIPSSGCTGDYSSCTRSASTWRTVLIGGMGMGGANRTSTQTCNSTTNGIPNCINSPISNGGLSSYFALDVTNPESPLFLWEFNASASGALGATTTGPIVVRESYRNASNSVVTTANGKWYAVFASGPTGPINTTNHEFLGQSDQNLKIFIVDLATGALVSTIDSGLTNAFAASLTTNSIDTDKWNPSLAGYYSDDAIYIGYTQLNPATGLWNQGGVLRLTTSDMPYGLNPATGKQAWTLSTLISGTGPVTTAITKLQDTTNNTLWIYFGTGRFYYNGDDPSTTPEKLYGLKEPCYSTSNNGINSPTNALTVNHMDSTCTASVQNTVTNPIVDQSGFSSAPATTLPALASGWSITLDSADTNDLTERIISDPIANPNGTVLFVSFKPNSSPCAFGGSSYVWDIGYNTGAAPPSGAMQGQALVQVSTGALQQVSLATAFASSSSRYNGRRLATPMSGVPPTSQGMALVALPQPSRKIMHYQEK